MADDNQIPVVNATASDLIQQLFSRIAQLEQQQAARPTPPPVTPFQPDPAIQATSTGLVVRPRQPGIFNGSAADILNARSFINTLAAYLSLGRFESERQRLDIALTFFGSPANEWINVAVDSGEISSFDELRRRFEQLYSLNNGYDIVRALDEMGTTRQDARESVTSFYSRFRSTATRAGLTDNRSNAHLFYFALRNEIRARMAQDANINRLDFESVTAAAMRAEQGMATGSYSTVTGSGTGSSSVLNRLTFPNGTVAASRRSSTSQMDVDAVSTGAPTRRARLTEEERQRRFTEGLCLVCASPNHQRRDCPESYQNTRNRQTSTVAAAETVAQPAQPQPPPQQQPPRNATMEAAVVQVDLTFDDEAPDLSDFE